ncbi:MAG: hypothetical protein AABX11_00970 [Nanoarchaeota archaeon]
MTWLDKLKGIINFEWNSPLFNINITKNSHNSDNKEYFYDKNEGRLDIFLDGLSIDKREKIKEIVKENISAGNTFLERNTSKLLYRLNDFKNKKEYNSILEFFKNIISITDYEALETSLFLRHIFICGGEVSKFKRDIRERFGERGKNIANLCTAGYFEEFLIPLYNSSKERFSELYELTVSKSPFAIFVHASMNESEIMAELTSKLEISKKYGLKFIHIHGISERNVRKVKEIIKNQKQYFDFFEKEIYEKDNIIIVELILK